MYIHVTDQIVATLIKYLTVTSDIIHFLMMFPYIYVAYTNRDGLNGFGTPWEIRFQGNYTILRKGGNLDGFSAIFSFIPELQLSEDTIILLLLYN